MDPDATASPSPPRVLVTGASGFLGSRVARTLAARGDLEVHALLRPTSDLARVEDHLAGVAVHRVGRDAAELRGLARELAPAALVLLAAAPPGGDPPDVDALLDANVRLGMLLVDEASRDRVVGVVHAGSWFEDVGEGEARGPMNLYGATKRAFAEALRALGASGRTRGLHLVLPGTFGPGDWRGKVVDLLAAAVGAAEPLPATPGAQRLDLLHVDDVAAAFSRAVTRVLAPDAPGYRELPLTSGAPVALRELAGRIGAILGGEPNVDWGALPYRPREVLDPRTDPEPAREILGWSPALDLDAGLRATLEAP